MHFFPQQAVTELGTESVISNKNIFYGAIELCDMFRLHKAIYTLT